MFQYMKEDNSYKTSSDPFAINVMKFRLELRNNLQKVLCGYLLRFRKRSEHKVFCDRGDNSIRDYDRVRMPESRKDLCIPISYIQYLYDMSITLFGILR